MDISQHPSLVEFRRKRDEVNAKLAAIQERNRPTGQRCTHCHEDKPFDAFPPNHKISTGHSSWCRACHNEASRRWRNSRRSQQTA